MTEQDRERFGVLHILTVPIVTVVHTHSPLMQ